MMRFLPNCLCKKNLAILLLMQCLAIGPVVASQEAPLLPDDSYRGLDGKTHSLREWRGKVVVLNFWASWCAPCLYEVKDLVRYQRKYARRGLQIIGLGLDDERKLKNVKRTLEINYPVLLVDTKGSRKLLAGWGDRRGMIPFSVIFGRDGRLAGAHFGVIDDEVFSETILPLLTPPS